MCYPSYILLSLFSNFLLKIFASMVFRNIGLLFGNTFHNDNAGLKEMGLEEFPLLLTYKRDSRKMILLLKFW